MIDSRRETCTPTATRFDANWTRKRSKLDDLQGSSDARFHWSARWDLCGLQPYNLCYVRKRRSGRSSIILSLFNVQWIRAGMMLESTQVDFRTQHGCMCNRGTGRVIKRAHFEGTTLARYRCFYFFDVRYYFFERCVSFFKCRASLYIIIILAIICGSVPHLKIFIKNILKQWIKKKLCDLKW